MIDTTTLKKRAAASLFSAYSIQLATTGLNFISKLVLARLITPDHWGLFAEALLIISVASTLRDLGLRSHLLRGSERPYGNVLLLQSLASLVLLIVLEVTAPLFAFFSPQVPAILRLLALSLLFTGLSATANIYIDRELVIQKSILPQMVSLGLNLVVSLLLAWRGWGVWSLVWGTLISAGVYALLIWHLVWAEARLELTLKHTRALLDGSKYLFSLSILGLIQTQVDTAIIGGLLSPLETGYYSMVYVLILKPSSIVEMAIGRVILPVFAELAGDRKRLGRLYREVTTLTYAIEVPIYAFIFFYPELVVGWLLGQQWAAVVPLVRVMLFYGILNPCGTFGWEVMKVLKKDRFFTLINLGYAIIPALGGLAFTRRFGLYGMVMAVYCTYILAPFLLWMLARLFSTEFRRLVLNLGWVYLISFSLLWLSRALPYGPAGGMGLMAVGVCWLILLLPYRSLLMSFLPTRPTLAPWRP